MKKERFLLISDLREKIVGKKRYLLRREVTKKSGTQYCIRDAKLKEIYKDSYRPFVEQYWEQYFTMLENLYNPFAHGDIVYEIRGKSKEDYVVYQVMKTTKTKVYLRKILVDYITRPFGGDIIVPKKDCFCSDEVIEKQIGIINRNRYLIKLECGILSEQGEFKILKDDKIWIGLD